MRIDATVLEDFRKRVVERLNGPPTAVQEVQPTGVHVSSGRHAWHTADPSVVEGDGPFAESLEIGGMRPIAPVVRQEVPIQSVEHDDDRFHRGDVAENGEVKGFQLHFLGKSILRLNGSPLNCRSSKVHA